MVTRATLNWRFFILTTIALLATFSVIHFWHGRQVRRQTGAYLNQANLARDNKVKKDERREIAYLERYLRVQPWSNETRERLARLYAKHARTRKQFEDAYYLLEDCLRRERDHDELRRFTIEFAMDPRTSLVLETFDHLDDLHKKHPTDAEIVERMGTYYAAKLDFVRACEEYQKAYTLQPDRLNAYAGHALVLRDRLNQTREADAVVKLMVDKNDNSFRAHLYAFEYGRKYPSSKLELIKSSIERARALAPDELDVILTYADWCRDEARRLRLSDAATATARLTKAREELQRGSELALAKIKRDSAPPPQAVAILLMQAAMEAASPAAAAKILSDAPPAIRGDVAILTSLVDYQIQADDFAGADATFAAIDKLDVVPARLAYDRARLTFARREWLNAARELQRILDDQPSDQAFVRSVSYLLGRSYEQIGETDLRLAAFTRAIPTDINDPLWILSQLGQAGAYAALGRADDALSTYVKLTDRAPGAWLAVARLRILQALRTNDPESIDWREADEAVQQCQTLLGSTEAKLIKADLLTIQKRENEARAIIDPLFESQKREPAVWIAKAFSDSRDSKDAGIARLDEGRKKLNDPVELRLAQAQLLVQTKDEKTESKYRTLFEDIGRYSPADRRRLLHGLAETASGSGFVALGESIWKIVVELNPDDLHAHLVLFDRAFRSNDEPELVRIRNEIARIDGDKGVSTRLVDSFVVIWKERRTNDRAALTQAMRVLDQLERDRPGWARIALGKALIYERQENVSEALAHYRKAVGQGESQTDVLRTLIDLLYKRGQFDEANAVLSRLSNDDLGSPDAMRVAADVALRADNPKRAMELAAKAVSPDSKNFEDFLWKGRLLLSGSDRVGARAAFAKAKELNPEDLTAWLLLIETCVSDLRPDEAESVFREAKDKVRKDDALLFKAQAHKLLGQKQDARSAFENARKERPNDTKVLRAEADFLMLETGKMDEASEAWKRIIDLASASDDEKAIARNMQAICVALHPDYATGRADLAKLGLDSKGFAPGESSISKRTQAIVLSLQRDRRSQLKAIELFKSMQAELTDNDRFLLAQWHFRVNNEQDGESAMKALLSRPPADRNPIYLSYYAGWLLSRGKTPAAAQRWVDKLEKIDPNAIQTIGFKVQLLAGLGKVDEARAILKEQAEKPNAKWQWLALIAEGAALDSDAELFYKRFAESERVKQSPVPDYDLFLAGFYARRGRLNEVLVVCEKAWKTCQPVAVGRLCVEALSTTPQVDPATLKRVAEWIVDAQTKNKNPSLAPAFQQQLASVRNLQGRYDEVIQIYRSLSLSKGRDADPYVLNNLAYLLSAHKGSHDEALEHIKLAKDKEGPLPDLLDTEALIRIARNGPGDLDEARNRLKEALDQAPNGAMYFHLARLEDKDGKKNASALAWRDALRLKLKASDLHRLEKTDYEKMVKSQ